VKEYVIKDMILKLDALLLVYEKFCLVYKGQVGFSVQTCKEISATAFGCNQ
jgi:hypothetical protein